MTDKEFLNAEDLENITGIPASTFRYWASINQGPPSMKLGRHRVWKRDQLQNWLKNPTPITQPDTNTPSRMWICQRCGATTETRKRNRRPDDWDTLRTNPRPPTQATSYLLCVQCLKEFIEWIGAE